MRAVDRGTGKGGKGKCGRPRGNTTAGDFREECVRTPHGATPTPGTQQAWPSTAELGWGPLHPFVCRGSRGSHTLAVTDNAVKSSGVEIPLRGRDFNFTDAVSVPSHSHLSGQVFPLLSDEEMKSRTNNGGSFGALCTHNHTPSSQEPSSPAHSLRFRGKTGSSRAGGPCRRDRDLCRAQRRCSGTL